MAGIAEGMHGLWSEVNFPGELGVFRLALDRGRPGFLRSGNGTAQLVLPPSPTSTHPAVDLTDIRKIVELMNEHELTYFHLEKPDFNIRLKKGPDLEALRGALGSQPMQQYAPPASAAAPVATAAAAAPAVIAQEGEDITSPMVGTFYRRSSPEAEAFVNVGDAVSQGQTLCIIEAMKVMNEIKAEKSGTILAILADDSTPVQYGDVLFRLK